MHEWALAEAVISAVSKIAEERGLRKVVEVKIKIGELQQIDLEAFKLALSQLSQQCSMDVRFEFEFEKAEFRCKACGNLWPFNKDELKPEEQEAVHVIPEVAHAFLRCPRCNSPDFKIVKGRGVWIESLRGEK